MWNSLLNVHVCVEIRTHHQSLMGHIVQFVLSLLSRGSLLLLCETVGDFVFVFVSDFRLSLSFDCPSNPFVNFEHQTQRWNCNAHNRNSVKECRRIRHIGFAFGFHIHQEIVPIITHHQNWEFQKVNQIRTVTLEHFQERKHTQRVEKEYHDDGQHDGRLIKRLAEKGHLETQTHSKENAHRNVTVGGIVVFELEFQFSILF